MVGEDPMRLHGCKHCQGEDGIPIPKLSDLEPFCTQGLVNNFDDLCIGFDRVRGGLRGNEASPIRAINISESPPAPDSGNSSASDSGRGVFTT